ncbi:hypothetical protein SISSUDRAFT_1067658 [Sistotremastrum suecicum HHB10207 ss-3]|uniref:DUF6535 domain-containing protein n=1 Tax=Sistotremastrum suecicum HHB10207 ss-3 TaxID=1314776 RepID=A0A165WVI0_9AGAM|nr:hypothetical protein SISSUDRAFT_1067658 [Sistotremastrum suecicum HHB10207 ss-3]
MPPPYTTRHFQTTSSNDSSRTKRRELLSFADRWSYAQPPPVEVAEKQSATIEKQDRRLTDHGKKLDALVRDAEKDNMPYDSEKGNPLESEQLWSGVYEIATTKMKEGAEEWRGLMDVSLVFIAIFLAVLAAFLVPAVQALSPSSSGGNSISSPPPLPPDSDQSVFALYYLSLIMAIGRLTHQSVPT